MPCRNLLSHSKEPTGRRPAGMKQYGRKWEKLRARVLRRDKYRSQIAKRYGKLVAADTVHHILPAEHFPQYFYASWNLISITAREHNELHDRTTHELTDKGLELATRTAVRQGLNIVEIMEILRPTKGEDTEGEEL